MKKVFLIIFMVGILLSVGIYSWQSQMFQKDQMTEISPDQLQQKIDKGDNFYVYFYSPTCEQCIKTEPYLKEAVKKLTVKNIVKVDVQKYDALRKQYQIQGTPTIYVYNNHKLVKGITGGFENLEDYDKFFQETGGTI
ncbi:thioredoxin family protein [Desulfosporosinus sp. SYSU MS00001]|uniref:thioredoxin family protein n=1 Tax=Desulfosporosinus sp. SYSU MS00001 TaxID=3416284 RepID=UPI003CE86455